ncbi:MAG: glycosyltransferase family 1 protein [Sediminibacterium sp.]|nr:glycosyltransferase family 1 protein [Sediminibacterium sp.]
MRIAINAIIPQSGRLKGYGYYAKEILSRMARQHPEHEFIFVINGPYREEHIFTSNVKPVIVSPPARYALSFVYWHHILAPLALRKYKPDVWLQPYGFCGLTSGIPQVLVVADLGFLQYPQYIPWYHRWFYQLFTKIFLRKAAKIITVSDYVRYAIIHQYRVPAEKVSVVYGAARIGFQPLSWQEKEQVKEGFADGREYFLFTGGPHPKKNLMNLLRAFSLFKKWQQSNMKLLITGSLARQDDAILMKLKTYKYRDDVVCLDYLPDEQMAKITAAAYALVHPFFYEGFGLPIMEAMQSLVPVIIAATGSMPEIGGDAALYADPADPDAIAKQMLTLYKDEKLRNTLIEKGKLRVAEFSWNDAAEKCWQQIVKAAGQ